jgi:lysozyme family protein
MSQTVQKYDPVFLEAVARVLADEGGYVCNPADPGGETNFGYFRMTRPYS